MKDVLEHSPMKLVLGLIRYKLLRMAAVLRALSRRYLRRNLLLDSVPGVAGHLLSRWCNSHLMDPMKHEMKYFPFPVGHRVALIHLGSPEVSQLLYANLASSSFRLAYPCFSLASFHDLTFFFC